MLYKTTTGTSAGDSLPKGIFMSKAELLTEYDRSERFRPGENTLDAFYAAGCYSKQFSRVLKVLRSIDDPRVKIELYNEYMERSQHQFKSLVLNGNLHSSHTLFAAKYIDRVELCVCGDLRRLVSTVFHGNNLDVLLGDLEDQPYAEDVLSRTYWQVMCPSTFVCTSWTLEVSCPPSCLYDAQAACLHAYRARQEMHKRHNERFFLMTPQNLKICNDTALSSIMYRMGQGNGWTYIGMPTAVCDAAAKLQVRLSVPCACVWRGTLPRATDACACASQGLLPRAPCTGQDQPEPVHVPGYTEEAQCGA